MLPASSLPLAVVSRFLYPLLGHTCLPLLVSRSFLDLLRVCFRLCFFLASLRVLLFIYYCEYNLGCIVIVYAIDSGVFRDI